MLWGGVWVWLVVVAWLRLDVQFVHLRTRVHVDQLVLGNVCSGGCQVGDGLALHTLEVNMAALALLLLPGHADEGPLDVVVDDLRTATRTLLHLLFIRGVTYQYMVQTTEPVSSQCWSEILHFCSEPQQIHDKTIILPSIPNLIFFSPLSFKTDLATSRFSIYLKNRYSFVLYITAERKLNVVKHTATHYQQLF